MRFTWDDVKRRSNLAKHRLDFADAKKVFAGATFTIEDEWLDYGEQRFITTGLLNEIVVVIAHTQTHEETRIISMRKATKNEQKKYFKGFFN